MELDNLKMSWNSVSANLDSNDYDIISTTKKEMHTPLTELKKKARKQTIILPILFAFLVVLASKIPQVRDHYLIWMAYIILPLTTIFYYFNLKLIRNLEEYTGSVKSDLQIKVDKLVKSNNTYLIVTRVLIVVLAIVTEIFIQTNKINFMPGLEVFKALALPLRLFIYVGIIAAHYFVSRFTFNYYFGKYLNRLKMVLQEMQ